MGTDKFYLSYLGSLAMIHVIDVLLDLFTLGITYFHETFGERNKIERWFSTTTSTRRL